jgi:hypothetical protein
MRENRQKGKKKIKERRKEMEEGWEISKIFLFIGLYLQKEMNVVPEGGMAYYWNLNQIIDGHTTIEHSIPMAPLYNGTFFSFLSCFFPSSLSSSPFSPSPPLFVSFRSQNSIKSLIGTTTVHSIPIAPL